jgi:aspartate/methionine/tyrosine aminotransferase
MSIDLLAVAEVPARRRVRPLPAGRGEARRRLAMRLASEHGVVVLPGMLFGAASWECRVSLASLDADQLRAVGEAVVSVLTTA